MLLLLLVGAGIVVPGERAYAAISYAAVNATNDTLSVVSATEDSIAVTTDANPTEE